jgi:hypothetical protein
VCVCVCVCVFVCTFVHVFVWPHPELNYAAILECTQWFQSNFILVCTVYGSRGNVVDVAAGYEPNSQAVGG